MIAEVSHPSRGHNPTGGLQHAERPTDCRNAFGPPRRLRRHGQGQRVRAGLVDAVWRRHRPPAQEARRGHGRRRSLHELPAGDRSWPYHYHTANEEALYVLDGTATLRLDGDEVPLSPGDYVALPADDGGASGDETAADTQDEKTADDAEASESDAETFGADA